MTFGNGTTKFDVKGIGEGIPGIQFRVQEPRFMENGEEFYVRTFPDRRASADCVWKPQYSRCEIIPYA